MLLWLAAGAAVNLRSCCVGSASGSHRPALSGSATTGVPAPLELQSRPVHRCGMEERVWITRLGSWPLALLWMRPGSRRRRRCGSCRRRTAGISASARNAARRQTRGTSRPTTARSSARRTRPTAKQGGRQLRLLLVHLISGCWGMREDRNQKRRPICDTLRGQIRHLKDWADARQAEAAPIVILGDFKRRLALKGDWSWQLLSPPRASLRLLTSGARAR